ncbi:hypothetical protein Q3G72_012196 [Acer saccharum]|nr:hypothetical protein Q3G72_012196 [Acer saccharum]
MDPEPVNEVDSELAFQMQEQQQTEANEWRDAIALNMWMDTRHNDNNENQMMGMRMYTVFSLLNEKGEILQVLEDQKSDVMKLVSEVREAQGKLWIGTMAHNHIATLPYP